MDAVNGNATVNMTASQDVSLESTTSMRKLFEQRIKRHYEELRTNAQSGNDVLHSAPVQRRYEGRRACKDTSHAGGKQVDKPMARFDGIVEGDSVQKASKNKGIER